eukprot:217964-Chlamydomonas_euryale.AAC.5
MSPILAVHATQLQPCPVLLRNRAMQLRPMQASFSAIMPCSAHQVNMLPQCPTLPCTPMQDIRNSTAVEYAGRCLVPATACA